MVSESDVKLAQKGDRAAAERILRALYPVLFGMIMRLLRGDRALAEDAAQESCLRIVKNLNQFRGEASFKSWALSIGYRAAQDQLRSVMRSKGTLQLEIPAIQGELADSAPVGEKPALIRHIWREVHAMPEGLRDTALLVWGEGHTQNEAATIMGVAVKTVEWRLAEVKKKLAHLADEQMEEDEA